MSAAENSQGRAQIRALTREITTLSATLTREQQQRAALRAHLSRVEEALVETEYEVREMNYVNNQLNKELQSVRKEAEITLLPLRQRLSQLEGILGSQLNAASDAYIQLKAAVSTSKDINHPDAGNLDRIQHAADNFNTILESLQSIIHNKIAPLEQQAYSVQDTVLGNRQNNGNSDDEVTRLRRQVKQLSADLAVAQHIEQSSTTKQPTVDIAVKELEAILPQYKAAANQLQGHASVLKAQLAAALKERDTLRSEAASWKQAAEKNEALYATTAAKLHSQEALSMYDTTSLQQKCDDLSSSLVALQREHAEIEKQAMEASKRADRLEELLEEKERVCSAQEETIARLEGTVAEQSRDIMAALDLNSSSGHRLAKQQRLVSSDAADHDWWSIPADRQPTGNERYNAGEQGEETEIAEEIVSLKDALKAALSELKD